MSMTKTRRVAVLAWAGCMVSLGHSAQAEAQSPCHANKDCQGELVCSDGVCSTKVDGGRATPSSSVPDASAPRLRVGFVYAPTILASDSSRTKALDDPLHGVATGAHHLGVEVSLGSSYFRYHLALAFSAADNATGVRIEPTTLGVAIPLLKKPKFRLELEPTARIIDVSYLGASTDPGSAVTVSSGADVRANLAFGRLFVAVSPLGFDVRYAGIDASAPKARAFAGAAVYYRLRLFVGAEF